MGRLAPAHHALDAGSRDPVCHPLARRLAAVKKGEAELIPVTVPEVRRLLIRIVLTHHPTAEYALQWSDWRRRHQLVAKLAHYRRRGHDPPKP